jgi:single-strand DNA-binding protein
MVNHAIIQGRLCAEPELRTTQSGVSVCSFRIAWSEKYKETETKLFLSCTAWRGNGEFVNKYFHKGQEIIVEGKLSTRDWEDKEGNKRSTIELTVDKPHFCGPKQGGDSSNTYHAAGAPVDVSAGDFAELEGEEDLPF